MSKPIITLATGNPHKVKKLQWILDGYFAYNQKQKDKLDVEESGSSFVEIAEQKALAFANHYHTYAVATDGGVLIPALGTNWNSLLTRRFLHKDDVTDIDRIEGILELMNGKEGMDRKIVWKEALAIAKSNEIIFSIEVDGDWGLLQKTYNPDQYQEGIWLCTLWSYPQFDNKNFFELTEEEKKYGEISWWRLREHARKFLKKYLPQ